MTLAENSVSYLVRCFRKSVMNKCLSKVVESQFVKNPES